MTGRREEGYALVSVLWAVAILSLIAAALLFTASVSVKRSTNARIQAELEAIAEAGLTRAVAGLIAQAPEDRWRIDGASVSWDFEGAELTIRIEDELGKVDLNAAGVTLIANLLRAAGLTPAEADALASRILDWRDADDLMRAGGAEADTYDRAGLNYRPRNGAFRSIEEVKLVLGVTEGLYTELAGSLTVVSLRPSVNQATAPKLALMAATGMMESAAENAIAMRASTTPGPTTGGPQSIIGRAFRIEVLVERRGSQLKRSYLVLLTGDPERPFLRIE